MFNRFNQMFHKTAGPVEYIIVGLGNPGSKYENTRHNIGFMVLDQLSDRTGVKINRIRFKGLCADAVLGGKRVLLLKPQTFMNNSGESVREAMSFYKIPPERVIVIFDDISLPCGHLRIRRKGSDGGHNGIKSIIYLANSDQFPRIKIGIGKKPDPRWDLADWVLSQFSKEDVKLLDSAIKNACLACEEIVQDRIDRAMNLYNS